MSQISFNCTVIKGDFVRNDDLRPSTYVCAQLRRAEILRTSIVESSLNPKWNQNYLISCDENDTISFVLKAVDESGHETILGSIPLTMVEVKSRLSRFTIWRMHRIKFRMTVSSLSSNLQACYKLYIGVSKNWRSGISENVFRTLLPVLNSSSIRSQNAQRPDQEPASSAVARTSEGVVQASTPAVSHSNQHPQTQDSVPESPLTPRTRLIISSRSSVLSSDNSPAFAAQRSAWSERRNASRSQFNERFVYDPEGPPPEKEEIKIDTLVTVMDYLLGPFPPHCELRFDKAAKRKYFVDHKLKTSTWDDPRLEWLNSTLNPLPENWDIRLNEYGIPTFIDHNTKSSTLFDPRNRLPIFPSSIIGMHFKKSFRSKMLYFQNLCHEFTPRGVNDIKIARDALIEDSFFAIMNVPVPALQKKPFIKFLNESGLDYGGLTREWLYEISHEILNPQYCLFITRGPVTDYIFEINPLSTIVVNYKEYFTFVGRLIGLALFHSKFLDCSFSTIFYKKILNHPCILEDIQQIDLEFYNSMKWLRKNSVEEAGLELYFCAEIEKFGVLEVKELKPGGCDIKVDEGNKEEYIYLLVDWKINKGTGEQMDHILLGLSQLIPLTWLRNFSVKEFEMLLSGIQFYDINDWKTHTRYKDGYTTTSMQVKWFWDVVEEMDPEKRARLVQFVTGTSRIPPTGFRDLIGSNGPQLFTIVQAGKQKDCPRAQTCFNKLCLPPYSSCTKLKQKLIIAIEESSMFLVS